jgi:ubiquitin carboxyl-terminal hydrolase 7
LFARFKFDDDRVTPALLKEVLEENFGGEQLGGPPNMRPNGRPMNRFTNAYMLVYIRESRLDEVLAPVTETDIPKHIGERLMQEERFREVKRREKEEQHLYLKVFIADDDSFRNNTGFDFVDFEEKNMQESRVMFIRIRKDLPFGEFRQTVAHNLNLDPSEFRFWIMVNRQNRTIRIDTPIPTEEDYSTIEEIRARYSTNQVNLRLYLEKATFVNEANLPVFPPPAESSHLILLFIKLFSPEQQLIRGVGHVYARRDAKVESIVSDLKQLVGFPKDQEISIYEEIKSSMVDLVNVNNTFTQSELQDGDILCVQRTLSAEENELILSHNGLTTVDTFLNYENGKVRIIVAPLGNDPNSPELKLTLHKEMGYEEIAEVVADALQVDADKLRLVNPYAPSTRMPQKRFGGFKLSKVLQNAFTASGGNITANKARLLYEKLDISLEEIESKCPVSVTLCVPNQKEATMVDVLMPKDSGIDDLKEALVAKGAKLSDAPIRIYDELDGKLDKEYDDAVWRTDIASRPQLHVYVEEIPQEEYEQETSLEFIPVFHFQRTLNRTHSIPFKFLLIQVKYE